MLNLNKSKNYFNVNRFNSHGVFSVYDGWLTKYKNFLRQKTLMVHKADFNWKRLLLLREINIKTYGGCRWHVEMPTTHHGRLWVESASSYIRWRVYDGNEYAILKLILISFHYTRFIKFRDRAHSSLTRRRLHLDMFLEGLSASSAYQEKMSS